MESTPSSPSPSAAESASASDVAPAKDPFGPLPEQVEVKLSKGEGGGDLNLPQGETYTNNKFTEQIETQLNVKLNFVWETKNEAYQQKIKLAIASNDLPDIFYVDDYNDYLSLIKNGQIEDLTQAFADYSSDELKRVYGTDGGAGLRTLTIGGKLYGLSALGAVHDPVNLAWVRKDWLDKIGLKEPDTVEDLKTIVAAFNEKMGTKGIPGTATSDTAIQPLDSFDVIFQANHANPGQWVKDQDGNVIYGSVAPETKQALGQIQQMYQAGLIDLEFATTKSDQWVARIANGKAGVFFGPWWSGWYPLTDAIKNDPKAIWRAYAVKDESGVAYGREGAPVGRIAVVKKGFKYPELLVKILNYEVDQQKNPLKGTDASWDAWTVNIPLWDADLGIQYYNNIQALLNGNSNIEGKPADLDVQRKVAENFKKGEDWLAQNSDMYGEAVSRVFGMAPLVKNDKLVSVYNEFYGQTPTMEKRWVNLRKLESDAFLQIALGKQTLDYFDEFVKQWNDQGGQTITQEVNAALSN